MFSILSYLTFFFFCLCNLRCNTHSLQNIIEIYQDSVFLLVLWWHFWTIVLSHPSVTCPQVMLLPVFSVSSGLGEKRQAWSTRRNRVIAPFTDTLNINQLCLFSRSQWSFLCFLIQFVVQLLSRVQLFATPRTAAHQVSLSFTISWSVLKLMLSIESVMPSNRLILCRPLLLLPSIFPSIRVFSNELVLRIRWPKYWSFSLSISPFNKYFL